MKKKTIYTGLIVCLGAVAIFSAWKIAETLGQYHTGTEAYSSLETYIALPEDTTASQAEVSTADTQILATDETETEPCENGTAFPQVDFAALQEINSQVVGWIFCEDTAINYPIAQTSDNSYYLDHLFDGTSNASGCIFLDCANSCDFSDFNSILYGHHMRNGSMFAALMEYKSQTFYEDHPQMLLMTPDGNYTVVIFAGYVASVEDQAWQLDFSTDAEKEAWLQQRIALSGIQTGVVPTAQDAILTLSTCSYEFDDARFVLFGILVPESGA